MGGSTESAVDADVVIVGYGPVGQTAAALLGRRGHRVAVYERYGDLYELPRAVHFDDEAMRIWQAVGIVDDIAPDLLPASTYDWFGADGEPILRVELPSLGLSGWDRGYLFFQPYLEAALDRAVRRLPDVTVHRGWDAEGLTQRDDHVEVTLRQVREPEPGRLEPTAETTTVRARYVLGADGANSFVRRALGVDFDDLGFAEHWFVVDVRPHDIDALAHIPVSCQWCDPARPHMHTRNGQAHRRFEFMLLPGERPSDFEDPARAWELLAPWMTPEDATIVRQAVYEFRGRVADRTRVGRVVLIGDAAHTMPPFMGQGLCSGLRDVNTLAWRLDLLLRGVVEDGVLDAYAAERRPQVEWIVNLSAEMGRVSCVLDAAAAAERDAALRAAGAPPPIDLPPLEAGLLAAGAPLAGARAVQGTVRHGGRAGRFDDVIGRGFVLLTARRIELAADHAAFLLRMGGVPVALEDLEDLDGRLTQWMDEHGIEAVLVRPDFHVFGAATTVDAVPSLLDDLRSQLSTTNEGTSHMPTDAPVIAPKFHHVNLKTTRLQEMIDFYSALVGAEVLFQYEMGAWLSNDAANHRIALLAFPGFVDDPEKDTRTGLHHTAFEYGDFDELNRSYLRLKELGITPAFCLDHGMTFSYYYADPDGNHVELQCDVFGDWSKSSAWMRESLEFQQDPLGKFVDPDRVAAAYAQGTTFEQLHAQAMAGELAPDQPGVELPQSEA
jgi:2-polyprenyl-6-methoxyphenol hydroxylase-like FAD-dependent oxidoreductase/catechol 2,3-dioxygenase-like lactoylglutathione lyase family enzyme